MKSDSFPMIPIAWEPNPRGVVLEFSKYKGANAVNLNMVCVRELRDDMEEADMLAKGFEKVDLMMAEIEPGDQIRVLGDNYTVQNILSHGDLDWVIQFEPNTWHEGHFEVTLPYDKQVTVYRPIAD
jgi:hypothetical protein